ncbi:hypothetical protein [Aestuariivirga sp.]|uniref:hypothetical protein n=1 Tax=Aestuariivirga sp. TaxID=2650926 RepID=UPI003BAA9BE6
MTARIFVTLVAAALTGSVPAFSSVAETGSRLFLAQAATPLTIPSDPATPGTAAPAPATPAAPATEAPATPPATTGMDGGAADQATPAPVQPDTGAGAGEDDGDTPDNEELSLGEIPTIETMELTPDIAKRALDSYIDAKVKYADTDLDQYENLQDFVDATDDGKKFEADVKAAGFANVTDWNLAVTTLGLTYSSITDDQTADLQEQIKEVDEDTELAQDMKDKMVKALKALIPSDNNKKVIQDLMNDAVYGPKFKQLDIEEE